MGCVSSNTDIVELHNFTLKGTSHTGTIVRIIDGDTYEIQFVIKSGDLLHPIEQGRTKISRPVISTKSKFKFRTQMKCRLYGVDTPEKNTPAGIMAKTWVENWFVGNPSFKFSTVGWDKYGRLLISIPELSDELITKKLARSYFGGTKSS